MRIWDIQPYHLCRKHLLGEHRELHAIWTILTTNKTGYRHHPETKRWVGKLAALYARHEALVLEMDKRTYRHHSELNRSLAIGKRTQETYIHTPGEQRQILKDKHCMCFSSMKGKK